MKTNLLITGGAGFIGSNLVLHLVNAHPDINIVNMDCLTYASDLKNLQPIANKENYTFFAGDITERSKVNEVFEKYEINAVMHLAAESHVDNSISGPEVFIKTNVLGTFNLLDTARQKWMEAPFQYKKEYKDCRFLHVSTDEVYGTLGETGLFEETTPYAPNSPYSASKAGSDFIVRSYNKTFGLNTVITNCSNNYGPHQHPEKLIPTIIRNAIKLNNIPIYGDGKNVRDWLYVLDHCKGIQMAFEKGKAGETYNIGGKNERENIYIANKVCELLDDLKPRDDGKKYSELITFVADRPGHDERYAIDATKIETQLGWKAEENFESGILKTIEWYLKYFT